MLAEDLKNGPFWPKNHFFTITTPKPGYIYPNNFSIENFNFSKKILVPRDPPQGTQGPYLKKGPLGYLGSLSQKGLGKIFSKCVFLNLLGPLGLPIPSYALLPAKKLKKFPRGCALQQLDDWCERLFTVSLSPFENSSSHSLLEILKGCLKQSNIQEHFVPPFHFGVCCSRYNKQ